MTDIARELLAQILGLPADDRLAVAEEILVSLDAVGADEGWDDAWLVELQRREASNEPSSSWDDVRARLEARVSRVP